MYLYLSHVHHFSTSPPTPVTECSHVHGASPRYLNCSHRYSCYSVLPCSIYLYATAHYHCFTILCDTTMFTLTFVSMLNDTVYDTLHSSSKRLPLSFQLGLNSIFLFIFCLSYRSFEAVLHHFIPVQLIKVELLLSRRATAAVLSEFIVSSGPLLRNLLALGPICRVFR